MAKLENHKLTIEQICEKMRAWWTYWNQNNEVYRDCNGFLQGNNQWDQSTLAFYNECKKPALTINLLYLFLKQVVGEQIQNLPELQVVPKNMQVPQEQIEMLEDHLRTIMIYSNGEEALQQACMQNMVAFSFLKVNTRYTDSDTFEQEIYFDVLPDPTLCGADPTAVNKCKDDGDYFYQIYFMNKEEWESEYPDIPWRAGLFAGLNGYYNSGYTFNRKDICAVADFYVKEYFTKRLAKVSPTISGKPFDVIEEKDFKDYVDQYLQIADQHRQMAEMQGQFFFTPPIPKIIERRKERDFKVKFYRVRHDIILETQDWEGKFLPMVYVPGADYFLNGQWCVKSFTQEAHDIQKSINVLWSDIMQMIKTSRRERTLATPAMITGFEDYYRNPERNYGVLPYNPDLTAQGAGGMPQFITATPVSPELLMYLQFAVQQLSSMLGRAEATLGINPQSMQQQPTSGKAYQKMVMQQNLSSYIQVNNVFMAVSKIGEIILDLIPRIYTDAQILTVYDKDFQSKQMPINMPNPETGHIDNQISAVKATVVLSPAPSFEMQKQVERDYITSLLQAGAANPQVFSLVADQMAQLSETSITPEIVKRLRTIVPPAAIAASEGKPMPPPPPDPMMQMEQQKMQLSQQQLALKQQELQIEAQKNQIESVSNLINLQQTQVKSNAEIQKAAMETYNRGLDNHNQKLKIAGDHQKIAGNIIANSQKMQQQMLAQSQKNQQSQE